MMHSFFYEQCVDTDRRIMSCVGEVQVNIPSIICWSMPVLVCNIISRLKIILLCVISRIIDVDIDGILPLFVCVGKVQTH